MIELFDVATATFDDPLGMLRAQRNEIQALYDYHIAQAQLARALGLRGCSDGETGPAR